MVCTPSEWLTLYLLWNLHCHRQPFTKRAFWWSTKARTDAIAHLEVIAINACHHICRCAHFSVSIFPVMRCATTSLFPFSAVHRHFCVDVRGCVRAYYFICIVAVITMQHKTLCVCVCTMLWLLFCRFFVVVVFIAFWFVHFTFSWLFLFALLLAHILIVATIIRPSQNECNHYFTNNWNRSHCVFNGWITKINSNTYSKMHQTTWPSGIVRRQNGLKFCISHIRTLQCLFCR